MNMRDLGLNNAGWLQPQPPYVHHAPSPNYNARPEGCEPYLLVIHNISLPPMQFSGDAVVQFFQNTLDVDAHPWFENIRGITVSAHFFIRRDGQIIQLVATTERAWHAGVSTFAGREACNDFSIGIELEGADYTPYTTKQYQQLAKLTVAIHRKHPLQAIRGHEHIAPGRKTDPGPAFDWRWYAQQAGLPTRLFLQQ